MLTWVFTILFSPKATGLIAQSRVPGSGSHLEHLGFSRCSSRWAVSVLQQGFTWEVSVYHNMIQLLSWYQNRFWIQHIFFLLVGCMFLYNFQVLALVPIWLCLEIITYPPVIRHGLLENSPLDDFFHSHLHFGKGLASHVWSNLTEKNPSAMNFHCRSLP